MVAAQAQAGELQTRNAQMMQTFVQWLVDRAETTDEDQFAVMASIVAEIMDAKNPAEVLAERQTMSAKDLVGNPLILHGFEIRAGEFEDSVTGHYAAMTVSRPGMTETRIVTCGGTKVLAKLYKLDDFDVFPTAIMFTAKQTSKGFSVLDLVAPV